MLMSAGVVVVAFAFGMQDTARCAVLDLVLPNADSMVARVAESHCGPLRLVVVGAPKLRRLPPGTYIPERAFDIPVAWENASDRALPVPISMRVDSAVPIQRGRQLPAFFGRNFGSPTFFEGYEGPWTFRAAATDASSLGSGQRSGVLSVTMATNAHTQGVRIWLWADVLKKPPNRPFTTPGWHPKRPVPLGDAVTSFVRAAGFPKLRETTMDFYEARHDLRVFSVRYGEPQDCVGGCFYSTAIGLQVGPRLGWVKLWNYDGSARNAVRYVGDHMFRPTPDDAYVLSQEFTDTVAALHWRHSALVDQALLPMVLQSPFVSRSRLVNYAKGLFIELDQALAAQLVDVPKVRQDAELLTLLANLPSPYTWASDVARQVIQKRASELIARPDVSPRTLFVLATVLHPNSDSALMMSIAAHPNAKQNPAILTVLAVNHPRLHGQLLDAVHASPRVKEMLGRVLSSRGAESLGWALLRDEEAGANEDVLLVLANMGWQEVMWAAARRLPETALSRSERPFIPLF
jgi:hypothetical protein